MGSCYAKKAVDIALAEVGYQGDGKYCKYSAELDSVEYFNYPKNGAADWCSIFVNWCIYKATVYPEDDKWTAMYMMYETQNGSNAAAGCTQAANYFKSNDAFYTNPQDFERGDQLFFKRSDGAIYHTGIITGWNEDGLEVVEGNTNGSMVAVKYYPYDSDKIAGVGRPRYDGWEETAAAPSAPSAPADEKPEFNDDLIDQLARKCINGDFGNYPLRKQKLNSLGYGNIYSIVQRRVNEIIYR